MYKQKIKFFNYKPTTSFLINIVNDTIYSISYITNIEKLENRDAYIINVNEIDCVLKFDKNTLLNLMIACKYSQDDELELLHSTYGLMTKEYKSFMKTVKLELTTFLENSK